MISWGMLLSMLLVLIMGAGCENKQPVKDVVEQQEESLNEPFNSQLAQMILVNNLEREGDRVTFTVPEGVWARYDYRDQEVLLTQKEKYSYDVVENAGYVLFRLDNETIVLFLDSHSRYFEGAFEDISLDAVLEFESKNRVLLSEALEQLKDHNKK